MHEIELRLWVIFGHATCLRGGTGDLAGLKRVNLLAVLVETHAGRGSAVTATLAGTDTSWGVSRCHFECAGQRDAIALGGSKNIPDDLAVDGARDAVLELEVHLGHRVLSEDGGVRDVTCVHVRSVCCVLILC
jgi:hypothetical protein